MKYRLYLRTLRLMDANLDRLSEGLRVVEDVSRFILGNEHTTEILKRLRHELTATEPALKNKLLASRDSEGDIGRESPVAGIERKHLIDLVTANAKRAQESLRVLEEFAKLPETPPEIAERNFEHARFTIYEVERELTLLLSRQDKLERIDGVYVIIDSQELAQNSATEAVRQVIAGGAKVVQLRDKERNKPELITLASAIRHICAEAGILFIVNDNVDIALAIDADGVHLGRGDLPVTLARQMLPPNMIIGRTARTVEQALQAQSESADYIGVGAIYNSPTKPDAEVIGLERLREIRSAVSLPIVALGGINESNAPEVVESGADCIAVISAVLNSKDIEASTSRLAKQVSQKG